MLSAGFFITLLIDDFFSALLFLRICCCFKDDSPMPLAETFVSQYWGNAHSLSRFPHDTSRAPHACHFAIIGARRTQQQFLLPWNDARATSLFHYFWWYGLHEYLLSFLLSSVYIGFFAHANGRALLHRWYKCLLPNTFFHYLLNFTCFSSALDFYVGTANYIQH